MPSTTNFNLEQTLHTIQHSKRLYAKHQWKESIWITKTLFLRWLHDIFLATPKIDPDEKTRRIYIVGFMYTLLPVFFGSYFANQRILAIPGLQLLGHYMEYQEVINGLGGLFILSLVVRKQIVKRSLSTLLIIVGISAIIQRIIVSYAHQVH